MSEIGSTFTQNGLSRLLHQSIMFSEFLAEPSIVQPIRLDANENPNGPSPLVQKAILQALSSVNRYTFSELPRLQASIAAYEGVPTAQVQLGAGISDLLEKIALRLFQNPGTLILPSPTFPLLGNAVKGMGSNCVSIPCLSNGSHNLAAMEAALTEETRLVYVCNPNNPTGSITPSAELVEFCKRVSKRVPVVVDEAYLDLAVDAPSMASLLQEGYNVIIMRTFSKGLGLAGLRIGYMLGQTSFLKPLQEIMAYNGLMLSNIAVQAAFAALEDRAFHESYIAENHRVRNEVSQALLEMGYEIIPSFTNFILFSITGPALDFELYFKERGYVLKTMALDGKTWCRLSLGTRDQMKSFCQLLKTIHS